MLDSKSNREIQRVNSLSGQKAIAEIEKKIKKKKQKKKVSDNSPEGRVSLAVTGYLRLSDKDRADWSIVKNIVDTTKDLFAHRNGPGGRIYTGSFTSLIPVHSIKVKTFRVNDKDGKRIGFNRATKSRKLREILRALMSTSSSDKQLSGTKTSAVYTFGPAFLARIFNPTTGEWELYDLDGQHRRHAHIIAGIPFVVFIIDMDLETARYNFILHNTKQTKVDRKTVILGSSNPQASLIREFSGRYDASIAQVDRLLCGLKSGGSVSGMNFNDKNAALPSMVVDRARVVLEIWTSHKRWENLSTVPEQKDRTSGHIYSGSAVLQALGWVIRDRPNLHIDDLRAYLTSLQGQKETWYPSGKLNPVYGSAQHDIKKIYVLLDKQWKKISLPRRRKTVTIKGTV